MKRLVLVLALVLTGCYSSIEAIREAEARCASMGGLKRIDSSHSRAYEFVEAVCLNDTVLKFTLEGK